MTDEHARIWRVMIDCMPQADLSRANFLDIGCTEPAFRARSMTCIPTLHAKGLIAARRRFGRDAQGQPAD